MTTTEGAWVPVAACDLPTEEQPLQVAEFDELFARALERLELTSPTRARLTLIGSPGLSERVQDLVGRESDCCSFFEFTVTSFDP